MLALMVMTILPTVANANHVYGHNYVNYNYNYDNSYYGYNGFYDVPRNYPYYDSITWMRDREYVQGYAGGYYRPEQCVNRAEFLKMLFEVGGENVIDLPYYSTLNYSDVSTFDWFYPYVTKATYTGAVRGYSDGSFRPGNCVTRAEGIKMATLYFYDGNIPVIRSFAPYRVLDNDPTAWYFPYVEYATRANIVGLAHTYHAYNGVSYSPNVAMNRGEVAELLYRLESLRDTGDVVYEDGRYYDYDRYDDDYYNDDNRISCDVDAREENFDPTDENQRIEYSVGRYSDDRVNVELSVILPNGSRLELRDISVNDNDDYSYTWNGELTDNNLAYDGDYEALLRVKDRDNSRVICTATDKFEVER